MPTPPRSESGFSFSINRTPSEAWKLSRKAVTDAQRHQEKVKEAVRGQLTDLVTNEQMQSARPGDTLVVPFPSVDLPRFRYDYGRNKHVGQGDGSGNSKPGDVVSGNKAGDAEGKVDLEAVMVSYETMTELLFEGWELPMQRKKEGPVKDEHVIFNDIRRKGLTANLDKRRSALEAMKREAMQNGKPQIRFTEPDLRFRTWTQTPAPEKKAVVIGMRDISSSMDEGKRKICQALITWQEAFLKTKYPEVDVVHIVHTTTAKEVGKDEFLKSISDGGTTVSSAFELALQIVRDRYDPSEWNIFPIDFTDGDNFDTDNKKCVGLVEQMLQVSNGFNLAEVMPTNGKSSNLVTSLQGGITDSGLIVATIRDKKEVLPALKKFFSGAKGKEGAVSRL